MNRTARLQLSRDCWRGCRFAGKLPLFRRLVKKNYHVHTERYFDSLFVDKGGVSI